MKINTRKENINLLNGKEHLTLLHISDIHLWFSDKVLLTLEGLIVEHNPELVVFTGDYFDIPHGAYNFRKFLLRITRHFLVVLIRGNHDILYGSRIADLLLDIPNCFCVENTVFTYTSKRGNQFNITSWKNKHCISQIMGQVNIILMHNPENIRENEVEGIDLILAGHLHGGQFIFFKSKNKSHFPGNLIYKYCTDRKLIGNTTLIVSKGLGDTLPLRFNCPKEVVSLEIK